MRKNKATKAILIILSILLLNPISLFFICFGIALHADSGGFENYIGWREVEIPTNTEYIAKVKIPKEWNFVVENGRIKLVDESNKMIAVEVYSDWRISHFVGSEYHENFDELDYNTSLSDAYQSQINYTERNNYPTNSCVYKIDVDGRIVYAISMDIYDTLELGQHSLLLAFESGYNDEDVLRKMALSFRWAGFIK